MVWRSIRSCVCILVRVEYVTRIGWKYGKEGQSKPIIIMAFKIQVNGWVEAIKVAFRPFKPDPNEVFIICGNFPLISNSQQNKMRQIIDF